MIVGIDIGTYQIKIVVANKSAKGLPHVIGTGYAESKGLRHGYIVNTADVTRALLQAKRQAEKTAGVSIKKAYLSVGGVGLGSVISSGSTVISRADSEITEEDIEKAQEEAEKNIPEDQVLNRKIVHTIPIKYKVDNKVVLGRVSDMKGSRLESEILFVTSLENHLDDLIEAVEDADIEVVDVMASPLAASFVTLTKTQKVAGCVLANIGAETVSIVVFENDVPISLETFPVGSTDITNDIALGLKIPLEEAEQVKRGGMITTSYSEKKLEDIVSARISDILDLIDAHLKKIGRSGLLPAGIILTGGGSGTGNITDLARNSLKLPSRISNLLEKNERLQDSTWAVSYGLCIFGSSDNRAGSSASFSRMFRKIKNTISQFLP
ncbi:MAG: cell division protein FtsA [Candidatus Pacebacteria bacterium]|nr:cell division protein FtsA [Candidatus Paceibacterota bacterium]